MDIGCGTLRGGILMIQYLNTGNYYVMGVRNHVLDEGRKEIKAAKLVDKKPTQYFKELYMNNFYMNEIIKQFLSLIEK